jgi:hypothetical protein
LEKVLLVHIVAGLEDDGRQKEHNEDRAEAARQVPEVLIVAI